MRRERSPNYVCELARRVQSTYIPYLEHHRVCPLVGIGTAPPSLPLPPPRTKGGGGHARLRLRGWGSPDSDDWKKKLSTLSTLLEGCLGGCAPWMKEEKGIRHRGEGAYLRCPVSTSVQFSLRNEGSSEYICVCEGRESLRPNFKLFTTPAIDSMELIP
jgi:hypothetical protein